MVPSELQKAFFEAVVAELGKLKDLGNGVVHRVAYEVTRILRWDVRE